MGRGRQKAKATKQAREMKYYTPGTDLSALERELTTGRPHVPAVVERAPEPEVEDLYVDPYADLYTDDDEDETSRVR